MVERWGPLLGPGPVWYRGYSGYRVEIHREVDGGRAMVRLYLLIQGDRVSRDRLLFEFQRQADDAELLEQVAFMLYSRRRL